MVFVSDCELLTRGPSGLSLIKEFHECSIVKGLGRLETWSGCSNECFRSHGSGDYGDNGDDDDDHHHDDGDDDGHDNDDDYIELSMLGAQKRLRICCKHRRWDGSRVHIPLPGWGRTLLALVGGAQVWVASVRGRWVHFLYRHSVLRVVQFSSQDGKTYPCCVTVHFTRPQCIVQTTRVCLSVCLCVPVCHLGPATQSVRAWSCDMGREGGPLNQQSTCPQSPRRAGHS